MADRSFVKNGTWHVKFTPNNERSFDKKIDARLSVSVYRRDMLTIVNPTIVVNLSGITTGVATASNPILP
ncbi:hypothetical protein BA768_02575 [Chryseobacterium sp. CBo1]|uniref:hypothetical protein n=1 Tax=Chryseobacterium sp. CBo1 TaxID=1869230 RepID=UPI000810C158|nr:hypothetical protein [Chryseobacterium sp. CBo1]OCK53438.1 hypothetical protein BA768_02575 [Chryseobacterium sp. CBo1]